MKKIALLILVTWSISGISQEKLDIAGKVKISTMDVSDSDSIVVWNSDGTLARREASTLSELQVLSISNDTIYLSGGGFVKLPAEVDGDVTNEKITLLSITGDSLSITEGGMTMKVAVDSSNVNELQTLSQVLSQDSSANQRIKNVIDPIDAQDAATKAYVDAAISAALSSGSSTMAVEDFGIKYATKSGIRGLIGEGYDIGDLIGLGVDTVELVAYGLIDSLISGGASLSDIRGAGVSVQQLLTAGVRPDSIYNIGVSIDSLYGKTYGGGLIFYLNTTNGQGLVSAPYGWYNGGADPTAQWGCFATTIVGAHGVAIGMGKQNTLDIIYGCIERSAASVCSDYYDGTYSDWFLPSLDELNEMYLKLKVKGLGGFWDFNYFLYWSSTQGGFFSALLQYFNGGFQSVSDVDYFGAVRCVRGF